MTGLRSILASVTVIGAVLIAALPAHADVMYRYDGDPFTQVSGAYTTLNHISGYFTVSDAVFNSLYPTGLGYLHTSDILHFSFSDGVQTLTDRNAFGSFTVPVTLDRASGTTGYGYGIGLYGRAAVGDMSGFISMSFPSEGSESAARGRCALVSAETGGCVQVAPGSDQARLQIGGHPLPVEPYYVVTGRIGTWTIETVSVPELAILPRAWLRGLKFGPGLGLDAALSSRFQHSTAWAAAWIVGARREGIYIHMPSVRVEVAEACSGLQTLLLMLAAAALIAAVLPAHRLPWALPLLVVAVLMALEANALRVAGIAIGLEHLGAMSREAKDWIQIGTTGIALAQLVGLVRLVARGRAVPQPMTV